MNWDDEYLLFITKFITLKKAKEQDMADFDSLYDVVKILLDLSKKEGRDSKKICSSAIELTKVGESICSTRDEDVCFASYMTSVFQDVAENLEYSEQDAKGILIERRRLSFMADEPDQCFAYNILGLEHKSVAEKYVECTKNMYDNPKIFMKTGEYTGAIIKNYTNIIKRYPEMADTCNEIVEKIVSEYDDSHLDSAREYCDTVIRIPCSEGAKEGAKKMKEKYGEEDDVGYQYEMAWHSHTTGGMEM